MCICYAYYANIPYSYQFSPIYTQAQRFKEMNFKTFQLFNSNTLISKYSCTLTYRNTDTEMQTTPYS